MEIRIFKGLNYISNFYAFFQISEADANRSLTKHRKIASSFRDTQLFEIFQLSCTLLRTAYENRTKLNFSDESQHELLKQLLQLGKKRNILDM